MPELDPTNSTIAPLSFKSAATHSAGIACPPVPPPAIRIRGILSWFDLAGSFTVLRYPVEDTHGGEAYQQTRSTVTNERERHTCERENDHGCPDVEGGLGDEHRRQACGHAARHHRRSVHGYPQPGQRDKTEGGDHDDHPDQAEFLSYEGEDHIRTQLGDVWTMSARPCARTEEAAGLYGHHGLDDLVARAVRCGPGIEEREEPLAAIGLEHHHPRYRHQPEESRHHQIPRPQLGGPQRPCHTREQNNRGAEVRFEKNEDEEHTDGE